MNLSLFLTLVVSCGVSVVYSQAVNSTWWPCRNLTHQHNVDLDQVVGMWYMHGMAVPRTRTTGINMTVSNLCNSFRLSRTPTGLLLQARSILRGVTSILPDSTYVIEDPASDTGIWAPAGADSETLIRVLITVIDQSSDNSTLALALCNPTRGIDATVVYGRAVHLNATQLRAVNDKLEDVLLDTQLILKLNTTLCKEVD